MAPLAGEQTPQQKLLRQRHLISITTASLLFVSVCMLTVGTNIYLSLLLPPTFPSWAPRRINTASENSKSPTTKTTNNIVNHNIKYREKDMKSLSQNRLSTINVSTSYDTSYNTKHFHVFKRHNITDSTITKYTKATKEETSTTILHIVTTRFMQTQAGLRTLAQARFTLWETFCFPTLQHQTTKNFAWFIFVDPDLQNDLKEKMRKYLAPHPNFFMVLSNNDTNTWQTLLTREDDRGGGSDNSNISFIGNFTYLSQQVFEPLWNYNYQKQRLLLLQTRLDADDGLHKKTLRSLQARALEWLTYNENLYLPQQESSLPANQSWQVICPKLHIEWRNDEPVASGGAKKNYSTSPAEVSNSSSPFQNAGLLRVVQESICVTPGYTFATIIPVRQKIDAPIPLFVPPRIKHQLVTREWPECFIGANNTPILGGTNHRYKWCWNKLEKYPAALRSRTITSAGMNRVFVTPELSKYDNKTNLLWPFVQKTFFISPEQAMATSHYLATHVTQIVQENLQGQCTQGHSCKNSSKEKLTQLLNSHNRSQNQHAE